MTTDKGANPWLAYRRLRPAAQLRLFCFPDAGDGASLYQGWNEELPEIVEVCPVQPPGREGRIRQEPYADFGRLVAALDEGLAGELDECPHVFFGHGLGAITAYELARRRRDRGRPPVTHLMVSARPAPGLPNERLPALEEAAKRFRTRLQGLESTPAAVLGHPRLVERLDSLLRTDLAAGETYRHRRGEPLDCPVTAFGGFRDPVATRATLEPWQEVSRGRFRLHMLPGDDLLVHGPGRFHLLHLVRDALEWQIGSAAIRAALDDRPRPVGATAPSRERSL